MHNSCQIGLINAVSPLFISLEKSVNPEISCKLLAILPILMLVKIYSYRNKGKNKKLNNKIFYEIKWIEAK